MTLFELLQIFGEGGGEGAAAGAAGDAGEGGAETVDTAADDGRARLLALGVPEDKLRKGRNYSPKRNAPQGGQRQAAAADGKTPVTNEGKMYSQAEVEGMMRQRVAKHAQDSSDMAALRPALAKYMADNGLAEDTDMATLARHMQGDYKSKAMELGVSEKTAMDMDAAERRAQEQKFRARVDELTQQAEQFKAVMPGFDLQTELQRNDQFRKLTSPDVGMSVEQAMWALHHDDMAAALMQTTQRNNTQMISNAIRSGSMRPAENGSNSQLPSTMREKSYKDMTPAERTAFKRSRGLPV